MTINITDRFASLLEDADLEVVADGFIVNDTGTAEMIRLGNGRWIVRAADADEHEGPMDRWDAARLLRDWDDEHSADDADELVGAAA